MSAEAYTGYMESRQVGRNPFIGPSGATNCYRQHAYRYFDAAPTDEVSVDAANFGTLLHMGWSSLINRMFDPRERRADVPVQATGMPRFGEADDVDFTNKIVTDVKTSSDRGFQSWLNRGTPPDSYWDQLELYAQGLREAHGGAWTLRILAFNVVSRGFAEFERPSDPGRGAELVALVSERHDALLAAVDGGGCPEDFPQEGDGPGSFPCGWCPWMSRCWGSAPDGLTVQASAVAGDPVAVGGHVLEYLEAAVAEGDAKRRKAAAGKFLSGLPGEYVLPDGSMGRVSMVSFVKDDVPDTEAMVAMLGSLGEPVPFKGGARVSYPKVSRVRLA